ncbi:MAG TPA: response regulator transcription factor [Treponemataceae bacterium]|jgi:two-component system phosphate regulon response regulator PhoB|nr:response regulator transcription factor [Treponemataceae bacterium]
MGNERVLACDDEESIRELVSYNLAKEGFAVVSVSSGEEAIRAARKDKPDVIILDLMLPGISGLDVCRRLKEDPETGRIPIIMLTAKTEDADVVLGLELGADDYVTKPFSPRVLAARVRAALRRQTAADEPNAGGTVNAQGISLNPDRHEAFLDGATLALSVTEFQILEFLARNPGRVFSRSQIISAVKGSSYPVTERSIDVQILSIRKKLGDRAEVVETVRGIGYRMRDERT